MTVRELAEALNLEILTGGVGLGQEVEHGYVSDLLSDVIGNAPENSVWVTVQRHVNILGVAKLKNIAAIITPRSLKIDGELIERARAEEIVLLRSERPAFEVVGMVYGILKKA
ncbi:MAG: serine kinase [Syntrophorhabdales bacterium]|jgi:predicted transcriptional regulator